MRKCEHLIITILEKKNFNGKKECQRKKYEAKICEETEEEKLGNNEKKNGKENYGKREKTEIWTKLAQNNYIVETNKQRRKRG